LSEREYTPGSRLPLRESGSGLPQSMWGGLVRGGW
jgi:hypothetical protein